MSIQTNRCGNTEWQPQLSDTSCGGNETRYPLPPEVKKTCVSPSVCWWKVSQPNKLFFNYSWMRRTSSLGSPPLIIFINPPISSIQQSRKLLLKFRFIPQPPLPHYLSSLKSLWRLLSPLSSRLPPLRQSTHFSPTYVCTWRTYVWTHTS